jgi:NDP-sugar pyrophosphorylase family protein
MTIALVMAGGRSVRMRKSAGTRHKALQPLLGKPLIDYNLRQLLDAGFVEIVVAVSAAEDELIDHVRRTHRELSRHKPISIECLVEQVPLGTIGAAGLLADRESDVLTVFVDNVALLDYREMVDHHSQTASAMTMAIHRHHFSMPFGQVVLRSENDGPEDIVDYIEKPQLPVLISSGTYILAPSTCHRLANGQRCDVPQLFTQLKHAGERVVAWRHQSPWIDINDAAALAAAEVLVRDNLSRFAAVFNDSTTATANDISRSPVSTVGDNP